MMVLFFLYLAVFIYHSTLLLGYGAKLNKTEGRRKAKAAAASTERKKMKKKYIRKIGKEIFISIWILFLRKLFVLCKVFQFVWGFGLYFMNRSIMVVRKDYTE